MTRFVLLSFQLSVITAMSLIGTALAEPPFLLDEIARQAADKQLKERFGEQQFAPKGGFTLKVGQPLPNLVWGHPELVATVVNDTTIKTRWFNEGFEKVRTADKPGRYYAYGEAPAPSGRTLRRAMTCCCVADDFNLATMARKRILSTKNRVKPESRHNEVADMVRHWRTSEEGAVELAAMLREDRRLGPPRIGQWQMENATRQVRLKRKLMGLDSKPVVKATVRLLKGEPAPVLRKAPLEQAGITEAHVRKIESKLDQWYASSSEPMAVVIARNGVIITAKGYGTLDGTPVTVDTPMLLHSAMKPLIGLQLAMYVDRGIMKLDEPIGKYLPDFDSPRDRNLTFRAGHVHATGIHFPWELAFRRLFYFHTWHESLIAHCKREWDPGARHRYGVVGVILSVRALELLRGRNYWDAMERDLFRPLGIRNVLPGGTGFSAESLARIGVLLDNRGKYGQLEVISEKTHAAILPTSLKPYFPQLNMRYGIGLKNESHFLGPGSYGHGGGCGTLLAINPEKHLVFAMVRNGQGKDFKKYRSEVTALLREFTEK
ncbi:MAG: beta-lactamase family protein [Planctomycetaceae bacterium]|jgi:CubicO group peptidase (beta-lactamase class C family)|nr:beta-lactamase family protein [Planctomycetaceae bacterium]